MADALASTVYAQLISDIGYVYLNPRMRVA